MDDHGASPNDAHDAAADAAARVRARLEAIAGRGSKLHVRHKLYVDIVSGGLPFLTQSPRWVDVPDLNAGLTNLHVQVLHIVDVVVTALVTSTEACAMADISDRRAPLAAQQHP